MNEDFHLYLDSADLTELKACLPHPVVHGVTTNPTLLLRAGVSRAALPDLLKRCIELGARQVQAQVYSSEVDGMLEDAHALLPQFDSGQLVIKIPATRQGLDAGARLIAQGVPVTWTAVYAPEQAHFAAQLGAAYAAPYLGRLDDSGVNGLALIAQMQSLVARRRVAGTSGASSASGASSTSSTSSVSNTRLLVASVRSREAYLSLLGLGVGAITIPPRLFAELLDHPATLAAESGFLADARALP